MGIILIFIVVQVIVAAIVIAVLNNKLKKELIDAALESLQANITTGSMADIEVISASDLDNTVRARIEAIVKRKAPSSKFQFIVDEKIKSGLIINVGDNVLDFSLADRLKKLI